MSGNIILDLDGVDGESIIDSFTDKIDVDSFSWGVSQPTSLGSGLGGGVGVASFSDMSFSKTVDKATPKLFFNCVSGKHHEKASIHFLKSGGDAPVEYLKIELEDVMITSFQTSDSSGSQQLPMCTFSLAYNTIKYTYTAQSDKGAGESPVPAGWDVAANKKL